MRRHKWLANLLIGGAFAFGFGYQSGPAYGPGYPVAVPVPVPVYPVPLAGPQGVCVVPCGLPSDVWVQQQSYWQNHQFWSQPPVYAVPGYYNGGGSSFYINGAVRYR